MRFEADIDVSARDAHSARLPEMALKVGRILAKGELDGEIECEKPFDEF